MELARNNRCSVYKPVATLDQQLKAGEQRIVLLAQFVLHALLVQSGQDGLLTGADTAEHLSRLVGGRILL